MRKTLSERVERARKTYDPRLPHLASSPGEPFGIFRLRTNDGVELLVLASPGHTGVDGIPDVAWEHVSVSNKKRCPTWAEMAWIKSLFWEDDEAVFQIHPPRADYAFCLHLWRPWTPFALPPAIAVGVPGGPVLVGDDSYS